MRGPGRAAPGERFRGQTHPSALCMITAEGVTGIARSKHGWHGVT